MAALRCDFMLRSAPLFQPGLCQTCRDHEVATISSSEWVSEASTAAAATATSLLASSSSVDHRPSHLASALTLGVDWMSN
jgi:hypothetical protein